MSGRRRGGDDRGSVVAEFAVALPAVVIVIAFAAGALTSAARQVRMQDAAADAARLAARGESDGRVVAAGTAAVPGAVAVISTEGDLMCVRITAPGPLPGLTLGVSSCALAGGL